MSKNFKFAFSKWLEWLQNEKRISINTFDAYERDLTKWSEFTSNSNNPKKKDFRSYMGYLLEKKNSRASIARKISSIRNFYKFASQRNFYLVMTSILLSLQNYHNHCLGQFPMNRPVL